jgi:hypothetical protein
VPRLAVWRWWLKISGCPALYPSVLLLSLCSVFLFSLDSPLYEKSIWCARTMEPVLNFFKVHQIFLKKISTCRKGRALQICKF